MGDQFQSDSRLLPFLDKSKDWIKTWTIKNSIGNFAAGSFESHKEFLDECSCQAALVAFDQWQKDYFFEKNK